MTSYSTAYIAFMTLEPQKVHADLDECIQADADALLAAGAHQVVPVDVSDACNEPSTELAELRFMHRPKFRKRAIFPGGMAVLIADAGWWIEFDGQFVKSAHGETCAIRQGYSRLRCDPIDG